MNLTKLFEMQRVLDERIVREKGLEGQNLLPQRILALQVELGECANEWRVFKFWSNDQQPRNYCKACQLIETPHECKNPLLEEYIDCLHFILSIGLTDDLFESLSDVIRPLKTDSIITNFTRVFDQTGQLDYDFDAYEYQNLLEYFLGLGEMLGFTWGQIETAYLDKNKVNHQRQDTGY